MPGPRCAVYDCNNSYFSKKKNATGNNIVFHSFPRSKDSVSRALREEWINRCKRGDKFNPDSSKICSIHFVENDYERDLQNELLGLPLRRILKKTAFPTVGINYNELSTRELRQEQAELITPSPGCSKQLALEASDTMEAENPAISAVECEEDFPENFNYKQNYKQLLKKYNRAQSNNSKLRSKIKAMNDQLRYYKDKVNRSPKCEKSEMASALLKKVFTDNQIALLSDKKKRVNWTPEEIAIAYTIRYYSKKCYLYLKHKLNYPMPALGTLKANGVHKLNLEKEFERTCD